MQGNNRDQRKQWQRILGRLRRIILTMPGFDDFPMDLRAEQSYRRSPPPLTPLSPTRRPPEPDNRPPGIDVYPGMDRDFPGPTDPEVFNRPPRPPTPAPVYEVPRMSLSTILTPTTTTMIDEVLAAINRENSPMEAEIAMPDPLMITKSPPAYSNVPSNASTSRSEESEYIEMSSTRAEDGSSRDSQISPHETDRPFLRGCSYDDIREPDHLVHVIAHWLQGFVYLTSVVVLFLYLAHIIKE
ncbi:uncharacterized protein [Temnothorax nylanderi]|uniref:uncharacterized protein n=1 Tax=Temnothorax nylanderi TaxID=102681 RepID=UPI003A86E401